MPEFRIIGDTALAVLLDASWRVLFLALIGLAVLHIHRKTNGSQFPMSALPLGICSILLLSLVNTPLSLQVLAWPNQLFSNSLHQQQVFISDTVSWQYNYNEVTPSWSLPLLAIWLLGCAWYGRKPLVGLLGIHYLRRTSRSVSDPDLLLLARRASRVSGISRKVDLRISSDVRTACCWGTLRPSIFLPASAGRWGRERVWHTLLHECAHIKGRDSLGTSTMQLLVALFWFIPPLHFLARQVSESCEVRADAAVLRYGVSPPDYAATLLHTVKDLRTAPAVGVALAGSHPVEQRITSILREPPLRNPFSRWWRFVLPVLFVVSFICFGMTNPWKQPEAIIQEEVIRQ